MDKKEGKEGKILTMLCAKNTSSKNRYSTTFGVDPFCGRTHWVFVPNRIKQKKPDLRQAFIKWLTSRDGKRYILNYHCFRDIKILEISPKSSTQIIS